MSDVTKNISILGSTGSIGVNTLRVVKAFPGKFRVVALAGGGNVDLLEQQVREFKPSLVGSRDAETAAELERRIGGAARIVHGAEGLEQVATQEDAQLVVSALVGALGLRPTYAALESGRTVALANKEALVVAGEKMTRCAAESGAQILPVDSEHNALHQCLRGEEITDVRRLWLTASGGPFRTLALEAFSEVTREQALRHPTWKMGPKITIDSATMMNKGLEVIEASWLFGLGPERIRVIVHPKSVVHSMVELTDGSFKAQLGITDMRHPIQYALTWPERWATELPPFDLVAAGPLEFEAPDFERFPCLGLAYKALEAGGAAPAVLNAANEVAVQAFLDGRTGFMEIPAAIAGALDRHGAGPSDTLEDLLAADQSARESVRQHLDQGVRS
jgi:1-deoxy-D-xylulose-5-phosphate reductoisomerase